MFSVTIHIKENSVSGEELLKIGKLNLVRCILVLHREKIAHEISKEFFCSMHGDIDNIVFIKLGMWTRSPILTLIKMFLISNKLAN